MNVRRLCVLHTETVRRLYGDCTVTVRRLGKNGTRRTAGCAAWTPTMEKYDFPIGKRSFRRSRRRREPAGGPPQPQWERARRAQSSPSSLGAFDHRERVSARQTRLSAVRGAPGGGERLAPRVAAWEPASGWSQSTRSSIEGVERSAPETHPLNAPQPGPPIGGADVGTDGDRCNPARAQIFGFLGRPRRSTDNKIVVCLVCRPDLT